jgi:PPOX class probable F420-dependent enzyme
MDQIDAAMRRRVIDARVARLATVRPDGYPHVVPITFALHGDTIVTVVDQKPKTTASLQRLRNIEAHPVASVIIDEYDDDWSRLWWVRADGNARVVRQGADHEQAVRWLTGKYAPYRRHPPSGSVIVVEVDRWSSWSARK